jgi:MinD superfamily P-loop ATPase
MNDIKEIVVISGKGGTGKTTITACLADTMKNKIIVDADVDAANLHLLLRPKIKAETDFIGKPVAQINQNLCTNCGICQELCRFNAIEYVNHNYKVDEISCDGCGLCKIACSTEAIMMKEQIVGKWFISKTEIGDFVYARLIPGAENSGNLVTMVRHQAKLLATKNSFNNILIDGPPGIGCTVTSAISGTNLALIVTEPTFSGINDLKRIFELTKHFNIKSGIIINRFDINPLNTKKIEAYAFKNKLKIFSKIPHLDCVLKEISKANIPSRNCSSLNSEIEKIQELITKERL